MEDDACRVDDGREGWCRPCGEMGFGLGEDRVEGGRGRFPVTFDARAGFVQSQTKRVQGQGATKSYEEVIRMMKELVNGGKVT